MKLTATCIQTLVVIFIRYRACFCTPTASLATFCLGDVSWGYVYITSGINACGTREAFQMDQSDSNRYARNFEHCILIGLLNCVGYYDSCTCGREIIALQLPYTCPCAYTLNLNSWLTHKLARQACFCKAFVPSPQNYPTALEYHFKLYREPQVHWCRKKPVYGTSGLVGNHHFWSLILYRRFV